MSDNVIIDDFVKINVKFDDKSEVIRHLFMKEHKVRDTSQSKPLERTLFMINIPPFVDHQCLKHLFSKCGQISKIWFHSKPTSAQPKASKYKYFDLEDNEVINGYKVAYVVFESKQSVKNALKLADSSDVYTLKPNDHDLLVGLKLYQHQYNKSIVDTNEMQSEINQFMTVYDKNLETQINKEKESAGIADADGWIKVTPKRRNKPVLPNSEQIVADKRKKRKRKSENLQHFYSFQARDSKIEHLMELRKKFEDDKKRIAIMKASRKFRPF